MSYLSALESPKSIFIIMRDSSGSMRSTEDEPVAAFSSREEAQTYLDQHTIQYEGRFGKSTSYCGGYSAKIVEVPFHK